MSDEWNQLKDAAALIETKIGHELNLIGQRMTWLVLSESFLFAAWINIGSSRFSAKQWLLYKVVWTIGFASAALALAATRAALLVGDALLEAREYVEDCLRALALSHGDKLFPRLGPNRDGRTRWTHITGALPATFLPPLFMGAWLAIALQSTLVVDDPSSALWYAIAPFLCLGAWLLRERWWRRTTRKAVEASGRAST
jgi:hypothetical protein